MTNIIEAKLESTAVITELALKFERDTHFANLVETSLLIAQETAAEELDRGLYLALDWPLNLDAYLSYLEQFSHWIPQQSPNPVWLDPGTPEHQEVYDRLCHFYYLIDQPVGPFGLVAQDIPWFSDWLVRYANAWGDFLNTPQSFNDRVLESFIKYSPKYRVQDSMIDGQPNNPSGWLTFNQFFARELNPGLRPIADPGDNTTVVCPADCTFKAKYDIDQNSQIPEITLKGTHRFASIPQLLEGSAYADAFAGGQFVHYFLGPYSYHRFHAPVSGVVKECYPIHGKTYLEVNLSDGQFDAPDSSEGGYEFFQARGVYIIDTTGSPHGDVGVIAVVPVGMCQVSSVHMLATVDRGALKGDEFGYFLFGGSDIIVLFQEGANAEIGTGTDYRHYGSPIANVTRQG
ncbi:MAG: phosphatidylserine decarboxylase [Acidobacteriota bacterium]